MPPPPGHSPKHVFSFVLLFPALSPLSAPVTLCAPARLSICLPFQAPWGQWFYLLHTRVYKYFGLDFIHWLSPLSLEHYLVPSMCSMNTKCISASLMPYRWLSTADGCRTCKKESCFQCPQNHVLWGMSIVGSSPSFHPLRHQLPFFPFIHFMYPPDIGGLMPMLCQVQMDEHVPDILHECIQSSPQHCEEGTLLPFYRRGILRFWEIKETEITTFKWWSLDEPSFSPIVLHMHLVYQLL